ncbi:hypothetical protein [Cellulomonas oligotrophica]|uniref:Uncharacterized protein n=1 Tax=Cellulomonas oligotrophica TaxID=931536 RepID=A0A7Y9FH92_9CELL|nr:hypothetical protein [Cellulomonas oligotrophica]NYD86887.1 hypothetical protein [Cellulomonas oligotrophica]GIG32327.1 hypothetical protein Col01nite_14860 [Cellulomonas oligotrophica]
MALLQKAVLPRTSEAYLGQGYDRVAGFVVQAADVAWAGAPADLFVAHGLGFPGSPVTPDVAHVDVLRFTPHATSRTENATGGVDQAGRARTGGPFVDRPPFTGLGFVDAPGHVVPLWWLTHTRVPAGAELVRVHADGTQQRLATFADVATGWVGDAARATPPTSPRLPRYVGPLARWRGTTLNAEPVGDEVVLASEVEPPAALGFTRTDAGRWRRVVPLAEVEAMFELMVTARWNGLEMRVVDQWDEAPGTTVSRVSYVGHDADLAEGLRLPKVDAGVYEATVPTDRLAEVTPTQLAPRTWPGATA